MLFGIGLMPHGNPVLSPEDKETEKLAGVLKDIGKAFSDADSYVLISPHNVRISDHLGVIMAQHLISWLGFEGVELPGGEWETDRGGLPKRSITLGRKPKSRPLTCTSPAGAEGIQDGPP